MNRENSFDEFINKRFYDVIRVILIYYHDLVIKCNRTKKTIQIRDKIYRVGEYLKDADNVINYSSYSDIIEDEECRATLMYLCSNPSSVYEKYVIFKTLHKRLPTEKDKKIHADLKNIIAAYKSLSLSTDEIERWNSIPEWRWDHISITTWRQKFDDYFAGNINGDPKNERKIKNKLSNLYDRHQLPEYYKKKYERLRFGYE